MSQRTYRTFDAYKQNKLAAKQADKMYESLIKIGTTDPEQVEENACDCLYEKLHESKLYKKHGPLYCQVLQDAYIEITKGSKSTKNDQL